MTPSAVTVYWVHRGFALVTLGRLIDPAPTYPLGALMQYPDDVLAGTSFTPPPKSIVPGVSSGFAGGVAVAGVGKSAVAFPAIASPEACGGDPKAPRL